MHEPLFGHVMTNQLIFTSSDIERMDEWNQLWEPPPKK